MLDSPNSHRPVLRLILLLCSGIALAIVTLPSWSTVAYQFTSIAKDGTNITNFSSIGLDNDGTVVFGAVSSGGAVSIYTGKGGLLRTVAREGDGMFTDLSAGATISENTGRIAVFGRTSDGIGKVFSIDKNDIFIEIARIGDTVTNSISGASFDLFAPCHNRECDIADDGAVAMYGIAHGEDTFRVGVYKSSGGPITPIIESDDNYTVERIATINNVGGGAVVLEDKITGEQILIYKSSIISTDGTGFKSFTDISLNDSNAVAFTAKLDSGEEGVFIAGNTGAVIQVADSTGPYQSFSRIAMNDFASVAFEATLDDGSMGIFSGSDAVTGRIIGEGDQLFNRTVRDVSLGIDARNDAGSIAFTAELINADDRVVRANIGPALVAGPVSRDSLDLFVQMSTMSGTGVEMSQFIATPDQSFDLGLELGFLTDFGEFSLMLGDLMLGRFGPTDAGLLSFTGIDPKSLFETTPPSEEVLLKLLLSGPPGATIRVDGVSVPGLSNGEFEIGFLDNWMVNRSAGGLAFASAFDTPSVPEPATVALLSIGLAGFGFARKRMAA